MLLDLLPIRRKSPIGFHMVYLHLTVAHSRGQSQGHLQFDSENFDTTESCWILLYVTVYSALSCSYYWRGQIMHLFCV